MDAIQCMMTRRSIRSFTGGPVSDEQLRTILEAGMMAPSVSNSQNWRFVVVREKAGLEKIMRIHPYASMVGDCGAAIILCSDTNRTPLPEFWEQDNAACMQNLMLAAHALGLGTVWLAIWPVEDRVRTFIREFNLPEGVRPLAVCPVGVPAYQPRQPKRYDESKIHKETW